MELYQLKSIAVIAREGNLTRAAEKLHLSQSALSSQLKLLEAELELPLFHRTPRGMELTEAGRELLPEAEAVLAAAEKLRRTAAALRQVTGEVVTIGLNADPAFLRIGALNRRLAQLHPGLNVIFHTSQSVRTAQLLRQGQLDLAFCYGGGSEAELRRLPLAEVRFCVVIPAPLLRAADSPDWSAVAALPWVWVGRDSPPYDALLAELQQRRLTPNRAVEAVDEYIVKELVIDGQGVAVMREDEARPLAAAGKVTIWEKGWLTLPLALAWLASEDERRRVRAVREAVAWCWRKVGEAEETPEWFSY